MTTENLTLLRNILALSGPIFTIIGIILTICFGFVDREINGRNRKEQTNFIIESNNELVLDVQSSIITENDKTRTEIGNKIQKVENSVKPNYSSNLEYLDINLNSNFESNSRCEVRLRFKNIGNCDVTSFSFFVSLFKFQDINYYIATTSYMIIQDRKFLKPQQEYPFTFIYLIISR